ncbi:PilZ domain-containing protein [Anaerobacillus sp. MEB173]|uniref:PilZ domain-containing protein n=1 Tax=Anaerobacillus sp. MEB173 TaxID=3383345 RepID=UPI003F907EED
MRYKRAETFRYEFGRPLECEFKIIKINGGDKASNPGKAKLHDISPSGLKISTNLNLLCHKNEVELEVQFTLFSCFVVRGKIVWQKLDRYGEYFYGVNLFIDDKGKDELINDLKNYIQKERVI